MRIKSPILRSFSNVRVILGLFCDFTKVMAEREGFEPSKACTLHAFQACSFNHSDISPSQKEFNYSKIAF